MTDHSELKRLAEAFPADLDWDSNTEPFFNGPSGESLGGGVTGFYSVYGKPFRLEGEDYDYDGPTYVEACNADFAKFMVAAREGVLALIAENEQLKGLRPSLPPRPPEGDGLPRFGLRWNGPGNPLAVSMDDGYWTPWHLAEQLRQWQPMETCPKHVDVLFFHERNGVIAGRLTDADSFMTDKERDEFEGGEEEQFAIDAFGFGHWGVDRMEGIEAPTHWMPYPQGPEVKP